MGLATGLFSIILVAVVIGIAVFVVFIVKNIMVATRAKLNAKGVTFTKEGAQVRVRSRNPEKYIDKTQKAFVKAWNTSETKGYTSRLWTETVEQKKAREELDKRSFRTYDGEKIGVNGSAGANEGWA